MKKYILLIFLLVSSAVQSGGPAYHLDLAQGNGIVAANEAIILVQGNFHPKLDIKVFQGIQSIPVTVEVWEGRSGFQYSRYYHLIRPQKGNWLPGKKLKVN